MIKDVIISKYNDRSKNPALSYDLKLCSPGEVSPEELTRCMTLIGAGGVVSVRTMKRDLPHSHEGKRDEQKFVEKIRQARTSWTPEQGVKEFVVAGTVIGWRSPLKCK
jgi:hypothetical protein